MAARRVRVTPQAERDTDAATVYLAEEADVDTGLRFFDAAHGTFQALLSMPGMGKVRSLTNPRLTDVRQWPVSGFERYLVFYRSVASGVEIIRVLHGSRDIDRVLNEETLGS